MAVLNDFALNGGIVPSHSRTGRPRTLCGRISSNEQFNHYINSSRTDNLNNFWMKGFTTISLCCTANTGHRGRWKSKAAFLLLVRKQLFLKDGRSKMCPAGRNTGSLLVSAVIGCVRGTTHSEVSVLQGHTEWGFTWQRLQKSLIIHPSIQFLLPVPAVTWRRSGTQPGRVADDVAFRNDVANPITHAFSIYRQKQHSVMSWNIARRLMCIIVMHYLFLHEYSSQ